MSPLNRPVYLDCAASTPPEPEVLEVVQRYLEVDFGNASSRAHEWGLEAKRAVETARQQVARVARAEPDEVLFTSGATESNNLVVFGLLENARSRGLDHVITTAIEHKAVLEPVLALQDRGFRVTVIPPDRSGRIEVDRLEAELSEKTFLVSVMHANNETGRVQPIEEIAGLLADHPCYLHVDAAQSFGRLPIPSRVDLISLSGHKIHAPKGVGALVARKRGFQRPPLTPLFFGGGHERGLRPGTLPVPLIAGLGKAAELCERDRVLRRELCVKYRSQLLNELGDLDPAINGQGPESLPHILNVSFGGVDAEALIVALREQVAISSGSACTSASYQNSHVLTAMQLPKERVQEATRWSWCHRTPFPNWQAVLSKIQLLS
jgi:cysteine desulfurase